MQKQEILKLKKENENLKRNFEDYKEEQQKFVKYQLEQKDGIIERLNETIESQENEVIETELKIKNIAKILWPQIDLLKIAEKYGTYKILVTYEQVCTLRENLKQFTNVVTEHTHKAVATAE